MRACIRKHTPIEALEIVTNKFLGLWCFVGTVSAVYVSMNANDNIKGVNKMKVIFKETTLTDGSKVHDIQLKANGRSKSIDSPVCIFSCTTKRAAENFLDGLEELVERFTVESLEDA